MAFICRSHLDLFGEAKGRSVTVKCKDFCTYPQMNFFDAPLTTSVVQPAWVALHFPLSGELICLSRTWHPHLITEQVRKSSCSYRFGGIFPLNYEAIEVCCKMMGNLPVWWWHRLPKLCSWLLVQGSTQPGAGNCGCPCPWEDFSSGAGGEGDRE